MQPPVSVIMPVLNEERYLADAVAAILSQEYGGALEVVLAVGPSHDRTAEVASELAAHDSRIVVVDSPTGRTPDSLNAAIAASRNEIVVRVDAHCELSPGYIDGAVSALEKTGADNVGGVMAAVGVTPFEIAVATAMTSPLGVGGASFHTGGQAGPADTVYLGVFRRSALERVGGYDPHFTRAQDWEMNYRIRSTGGLVWFDPNLQVTYRPRSTLPALRRQYFDYGSWRREVMRNHPGTVSLRYLAAPAAVLGSLIGIVLASLGMRWALIAPIGYLAIELAASAALARKAGRGARYVPIVLLTMHVSWGLGFLTSRRKR